MLRPSPPTQTVHARGLWVKKMAEGCSLELAYEDGYWDVDLLSVADGSGRQPPLDRATQFNVGRKRAGEDGNMWEVKATRNGDRVRRVDFLDRSFAARTIALTCMSSWPRPNLHLALSIALKCISLVVRQWFPVGVDNWSPPRPGDAGVIYKVKTVPYGEEHSVGELELLRPAWLWDRKVR